VTYAYLVGRQIVNIIFMHWYERSLSILGQAFQVVSVQFPYLLNSCPIMKDVSKIILQCIVASANSSRRSAPNFSGETVSEGSLLGLIARLVFALSPWVSISIPRLAPARLSRVGNCGIPTQPYRINSAGTALSQPLW